jgi:dephospho-CoA kinase
MLKVGLTGGLGCGKTFVAKELERLGCHIIHADRLGHDVLARGGLAYDAAVGLLGPSILKQDSTIDRERVAELVFGHPERLAALNAIVHPAVRRLENDAISRIAEQEPDAVVVIEAAILIEAGLYKDYDYLVVVTCSSERQMERALARPGAVRQDIEARVARQMPPEEKRRFANYVIDSSGTEEETLRQTRELYLRLKESSQQRAGRR